MAMSETKRVGRGVFIPGNNLDTDQITPARYLKCVTFDELSGTLFMMSVLTPMATKRSIPSTIRDSMGRVFSWWVRISVVAHLENMHPRRSNVVALRPSWAKVLLRFFRGIVRHLVCFVSLLLSQPSRNWQKVLRWLRLRKSRLILRPKGFLLWGLSINVGLIARCGMRFCGAHGILWILFSQLGQKSMQPLNNYHIRGGCDVEFF